LPVVINSCSTHQRKIYNHLFSLSNSAASSCSGRAANRKGEKQQQQQWFRREWTTRKRHGMDSVVNPNANTVGRRHPLSPLLLTRGTRSEIRRRTKQEPHMRRRRSKGWVDVILFRTSCNAIGECDTQFPPGFFDQSIRHQAANHASRRKEKQEKKKHNKALMLRTCEWPGNHFDKWVKTFCSLSASLHVCFSSRRLFEKRDPAG
jgi:hypothetical protein